MFFNTPFVFGEYEIENFKIVYEDLKAEVVKKKEDFYIYVRVFKDDIVEKIVCSRNPKIIVNPVEPVNLPKHITNYLMIELDKSIFIEPKGSNIIYTTFPIEIAVLLVNDDVKILDIFSFLKQKYTLYGNPAKGLICRYWKGKVFDEAPETDWVKEGLLKLKIYNESDEWQEVRRVVFDVYDMKIYYGERVYCEAFMKIISSKVAETGFIEFEHGKKSIELYIAKKIPIVKKKFYMEWGLC